MGVLPSTQSVATISSSFSLSSFDLVCTCCAPYVEATVIGVGSDAGRDDCNDDGCTSTKPATIPGDDCNGSGLFPPSHVHVVSPEPTAARHQSHISHTPVTPVAHESHVSHTSATKQPHISHTSVTHQPHIGTHQSHISQT